MKKALLFVLALIAVGCADPIPRNLDDLSMQGPQYLDPETLEPYSGPAFRLSEDDSRELVLRVNLRDGRFQGDFEVFYPSGVFGGRGTYENGLAEGPYESYYENGELRTKINYTAGELDGPFEAYHENGQLQETSNFTAGELGGPFESYNENGQLEYRGTVDMGNRCGEWIVDGEARTYDPCPPNLADGN